MADSIYLGKITHHIICVVCSFCYVIMLAHTYKHKRWCVCVCLFTRFPPIPMEILVQAFEVRPTAVYLYSPVYTEL